MRSRRSTVLSHYYTIGDGQIIYGLVVTETVTTSRNNHYLYQEA